jgi:hypothetical protein
MEEQNNQGQQNQQQEQAQQNQPEKTFTQADVDTIVARRLAKVQKGMPDEAELTAFRAWKESQQTEQQRWEALTKERDDAKNDLTAALGKVEQYERERLLLSKGIPAEDVDYYAFKAGKLVSDTKTFEQAADEVINARKPQANNESVRIDFGAPLNGGAPTMTVDEIMAVQDDAKRQALIAQYHHLFGF